MCGDIHGYPTSYQIHSTWAILLRPYQLEFQNQFHQKITEIHLGSRLVIAHQVCNML